MDTLLEMNPKELSRLEVMQRLSRKQMSQKGASRILDLSTRQIKRLLRAYRQEGATGLGGARQLANVNYGDILAIGGSFFYAFYLLVTQRVRENMDTLSFLALSTTSSIVILLATCLVLGAPLSGFSTQAWTSLAALDLFSHLGGYLAINYALGHLRASSVSVSLLGQPVITALISIPLLGEFLSVQQILGGTIVLIGIYLVNRRGSSGNRTKSESLSTEPG